jgi:glutamate-1-semialdehyde 2,1-aminomutase
MNSHAAAHRHGNLEAAAERLRVDEERIYAERRPKALEARNAPGPGFFDQVPLHWMLDWPTPFPMLIERASGTTIADIDGNALVDFCLGDTGAMFGHGPPPIVRAMAQVAERGLTTMLPSADTATVGRLLAERFRLPRWQIATTASDANRFAIRVARAVTGRRKIVVFDGCYHGAVDDTLVDLVGGKTVPRRNLLGQVADTALTTTCIPFNDRAALETVLATGQVAAVLAEPVMTNCGMILPQPGFLDFLREATRSAGTLLHIDETHTMSTGLGGYSAKYGLDPDILVAGKPVGGGVPVAVWGMTEHVAERLAAVRREQSGHGHSGIGTTLSGSAFQLACLRACLEAVMTQDAYSVMNARADRLEGGLTAVISERELPWHVVRVGARLEVVFSPTPVTNAVQARAAASNALESALHLSLLNRGFLVTPFHNMILVAPTITPRDVEGLLTAYADALDRLLGYDS